MMCTCSLPICPLHLSISGVVRLPIFWHRSTRLRGMVMLLQMSWGLIKLSDMLLSHTSTTSYLLLHDSDIDRLTVNACRHIRSAPKDVVKTCLDYSH
jgi:hypothetical protein